MHVGRNKQTASGARASPPLPRTRARALQVFAAVLAILAAFSAPAAWDLLSMDGAAGIFVNPQARPTHPPREGHAGGGSHPVALTLPPTLPPTTTTHPTLCTQQVVIYACVLLMARHMASKPAPLLAVHVAAAAVAGAALALGVCYAAAGAVGWHRWASNGAEKVGGSKGAYRWLLRWDCTHL